MNATLSVGRGATTWFALALALAGCEAHDHASHEHGSDAGSGSADGSAAAPTLSKLAAASAGAIEVELWAPSALRVGYQDIALRVRNAGTDVKEAALTLRPKMVMPMHAHACPLTQPADKANAGGYFVGALMPQMANTAESTWSLEVDVALPGAASVTVAFAKLEVGEGPFAEALISGSGMAAKRFVVVLHFPVAPKVGKNTYRLGIFQASADMLAYPPVADAALTATPEMPSMGHGSADNVAPVATGGGFYEGVVNLTMPGDWRLKVDIAQGGLAIGTVAFDWEI